MRNDETENNQSPRWAPRLGAFSSKTLVALGLLFTLTLLHLGNQSMIKNTLKTPEKPQEDQQHFVRLQGQVEQLQTIQHTVLQKITSLGSAPAPVLSCPACPSCPSFPKSLLHSASQKTLSEDSASETPERTVRIFDAILFSGELDTLELRLHELYPVVDVFFVMEAEWSFSGQAKTLQYKAHERRFEQFRDKIVYVVIPPITPEEDKHYRDVMQQGYWTNEVFSRNKGLEMGIHAHRPREGDWIILSDLDEIPRRSMVEVLRQRDPKADLEARIQPNTGNGDGDVFRLGCKFYYYSFEFRNEDDWIGPVAARYREPDSAEFTKEDLHPHASYSQALTTDDWKWAGSKLRAYRDMHFPLLNEECYHCTWCFSNMSQIQHKMESYSHTEHNQAQFREANWILDHVRRGVDLFDRPLNYIYNGQNEDIPIHIAENKEKYAYMLYRKDKADAGFIDVDPEVAAASMTATTAGAGDGGGA